MDRIFFFKNFSEDALDASSIKRGPVAYGDHLSLLSLSRVARMIG